MESLERLVKSFLGQTSSNNSGEDAGQTPEPHRLIMGSFKNVEFVQKIVGNLKLQMSTSDLYYKI